MENYNLTPEIIKEHLLDLQFNPKKLDLMAKISANIKGKLTRMYNKKHETSLKAKKTKQGKSVEVGGAKYNDMMEELVDDSMD